MGLFVDAAIEAINKFVLHYRIIADRPYIQPVTPEVIQEFYIETQFEDGSLQTQEFGAGGGPLMGLVGRFQMIRTKHLEQQSWETRHRSSTRF